MLAAETDPISDALQRRSKLRQTLGLVSIIVPTKNSAPYLALCLESIARQTYPDIELIVVDNFSSDSTQRIALGYTERVFSCGPERSAQVNYGVRQASGEFVYKVDSDFVLQNDVVEQCVDEMSQGYDAIVVHNTPDIRAGWIARIRKFEVDMYKYDLTHSSARFVRRVVYDELGGFDESITAGEDYDFQNRLNSAGYKTGFVSSEALHLGEPRSFIEHMRKYFSYGVDFVAYVDRNPTAARRQLRFARGVYWKHWRAFVRHPVRAGIFIIYNFCKFAAGGAGFVVGRLRNRAALIFR